MGRSSSLSGLFTAFSFPLGAAAMAWSGKGVLGTPADTLACHAGSASCCVAMPCASSCAGGRGRSASSSEGSGEAILGTPGVESGEHVMLRGEVARAERRHRPPQGAERSERQRHSSAEAAFVVG
jgi:hypothetical protein